MNTAISGVYAGLSAGDYTAQLASVGASLRTLEHRGVPLVVPFDDAAVRPVFRGAILAPWPNRVVDGHYRFAGVEQQLALTEPARGHALHGLATWLDFDITEEHPDSVTLEATIQAQAGYPHRIDVSVTYRLDQNGLHTVVSATNTGTTPAPWGTGPHPYLVAGRGHVDDWTLTLPADQVLTVTDDRLIPIGLADVSTEGNGIFDFREPRVIADTFIDHAFTHLHRDSNGMTTVTLRENTTGSGVEMTWDESCPWVQIHTADLPDPQQSRLGLAVEPMTCPPDAYNSGTDLIVINPGENHRAGWTIRALCDE